MIEPISDKLLTDSIHRIAQTPDGTGLYLYLQRKLMTIEPDLSALPRAEGARMFAAELINLMAKGILESGGRTNPSTGGSPEQPLVFATPEPVTVRGSRGAARRVGPDTVVPGWDTPDTRD